MSRRTRLSISRSRLVAAATVAMTLVAASAAPSPSYAGTTIPTGGLVSSAPRASGSSLSVSSTAMKVVSSTGHRLRVQVNAYRNSSGTSVAVTAETRDKFEQHTWSFTVPGSAMSVSAGGKGMIHLSTGRSDGFALVSLKAVPHGRSTTSSCQGKTAFRTRHVELSGRVLLHTRSHGKHAWGTVGSTHHVLTFSKRSKVTLQKPAASNCQNNTTTFPCRDTLLWMSSAAEPKKFRLLAGENKGSGSLVAGERSVSLGRAGATRTDNVTHREKSQITLSPGTSVTMHADLHGGGVTMDSFSGPSTDVQRCAGSKKKVSIDSWQAAYTNDPVPLTVPEQIFGTLSLPDASDGAGIFRITLLP